MQLKQRFQLQISIRPQNDVPKIELGPGLQSGLKIAEGTSKLLTSDLITVTDPDSTNADIIITLGMVSIKLSITSIFGILNTNLITKKERKIQA